MAVEKAVLAVRGPDPPVNPTARDRTVSIAKGLVGGLPFAGAILAEVIGQIVPEQRWERIREWSCPGFVDSFCFGNQAAS